MLTIKTDIKKSSIHGYGVFCKKDIAKGEIVWDFKSPDKRKLLEDCSIHDLHFGYINPENPDWLVLCGDESIWMNFSTSPNLGMLFDPTMDKEAPLVALHDILAGNELTVGIETDFDAKRKLSL